MGLSIFVWSCICVCWMVDGFSFEVRPMAESCFYEVAGNGHNIAVTFQVTAGGFLDIDLFMKDPIGKVIYNGKGESDGRYSFIANMNGTYSFCFSNYMSTVTIKQVELKVVVKNPVTVKKDIASEDELPPLINSLKKLENYMAILQDDYDYLKMREHAHRNTNESTHDRVVYWSIFEIFILMLMSVCQIIFLRRFFQSPLRPY